MSVETADFIDELDATLPTSGDLVSEGDNHLRLIKEVLQNSFPNLTKAEYFKTVQSVTVNTFNVTEAMDKTFFIMNANSGDKTVNLPALGANDAGWSAIFTKSDSTTNLVVLTPASGTIVGQNALTLHSQYQQVELTWGGAGWHTNQRQWTPWLKTKAETASTTLQYRDMGTLLLAGHPTNDITITLPSLTNFKGMVVGIRHSGGDGTTVTIDGSGSQQVNDALTMVLSEVGTTAWLVATATEWVLFNYKAAGGFGPDVVNTWTASQIFNQASLILWEQVLTFGSVIAWNHNLGNHARVTITGDCTFANPTNKRNFQSGFLRVAVDGNHDINWASVFEFVDGEPDLQNNSTTIFQYYVASSALIYIWKVAGSSGFTEYNKGQANAGQLYTQAHGLGEYPRDVSVWLSCTSASDGFAVGDRIKVFSDSGDSARGCSITVNTSNVRFQIGNGGLTSYTPGSGSNNVLNLSNFNVIFRVYS